MALVHISGNLGQAIYPLIEDPNTSTNRLYLSSMAHDATFLTPQFNSYFHYQDFSLLINTLSPSPWNGSGTYYGSLRLIGNSIQCSGAAADTGTNANRDAYSSFHRSLDPVNFPAKVSWYTTSTQRAWMTWPFSNDGVNISNQNFGQFGIFGPDITQGYIYNTTRGSIGAGGAALPQNYFWEDTFQDMTATGLDGQRRWKRLWGLATNNAPHDEVTIVNRWDDAINGPVSFLSARDSNANTTFFVGVEPATSATVWCTMQDSVAGNPYTLTRISWAGTNSTMTTSTNINAFVASLEWNLHSRPSNIRYDASNKRVFYSSHFDFQGNLAPVVFRWDPLNITATGASIPPPITTSTCTMVYGSTSSVGAYALFNYAGKYGITGGSAVAQSSQDAWHIQPWQFQPVPNGLWYITFWLSDKSNHQGSAPTRWNTSTQRTMLTFTINTATDSTLTYHSRFTFQDNFNMPRDWLPLNAIGDMMVVPTYTKTNFMRFSTTSGWYISSVYPYEMSYCGLDARGRLWMQGRELGNYTVHLLTLDLPSQVSVVMPTQNLLYTGTNILTTASLFAYNYAGDAITATVYLTIQGNSMVFTDNGTVNQTYTTNATTSTPINLTISGGGINNILVGAAI